MRLSAKEQRIIRDIVSKYDPDANVYLYGSRTRDDLRGGDIDLLVFSDKITFSDKIGILSDLKALLDDQKFDLTLSPQQPIDAFVKQALAGAIKIL